MTKNQKYLKNTGLIIFLSFLATITPMTIDMYLPALPKMTDFFNTTDTKTSLTILCYFLFYAISMLYWGPASDKHGRKKILFACIFLYILGSFLGIKAKSIELLIIYRAIQAIGGGGIMAMATAIIKDSFEGRKREITLSIVQSMMIIGPIIAPIIGGMILAFASWQFIFIIFTIMGILLLIPTVLLEETLCHTKRTQGRTFKSLKNIGIVLKNPRFSLLLVTFSLIGIPYFAYLTTAAYIFQDDFKLSEQEFSYFFSAIGIVTLLGPFLYVVVSKYFPKRYLISIAFSLLIFFGFSTYYLGCNSPVIFAILYAPNAIINSFLRPPATNLMLEQENTYTGTAASLISFSAIFIGSIGMLISYLFELKYEHLIGLEMLGVGIICTLLWSRNAKKFC